MIIVKDTAGQLYAVRETGDPALAHVWWGVPVKWTKGSFAPKAGRPERLIRKEGCVAVVAIAGAPRRKVAA